MCILQYRTADHTDRHALFFKYYKVGDCNPSVISMSCISACFARERKSTATAILIRLVAVIIIIVIITKKEVDFEAFDRLDLTALLYHRRGQR